MKRAVGMPESEKALAVAARPGVGEAGDEIGDIGFGHVKRLRRCCTGIWARPRRRASRFARSYRPPPADSTGDFFVRLFVPRRRLL